MRQVLTQLLQMPCVVVHAAPSHVDKRILQTFQANSAHVRGESSAHAVRYGALPGSRRENSETRARPRCCTIAGLAQRCHNVDLDAVSLEVAQLRIVPLY